MRLLNGPPGSGKTHFVLESLRAALRAHDASVRTLAPTATLVQHLQNQLAREGFAFRADLVQTLHDFVNAWAGDHQEVPGATLYLLVERAVRRVNRPEFGKVARLPGFSAALAGAIEELSAAGCDSERLARRTPPVPLAGAFLAVYRQVERDLEARGLALRGARLLRAAERIERDGIGEIRTLLLDGFHALPEPELRVIAALENRANVVVCVENEDLEDALGSVAPRGSRETLSRVRQPAERRLFRAPSMEREVEEIARRIVRQAESGRPFREIGVVVRSPETYKPLLRTTLARFGVPARFYFDEPLDRHAAIRLLSGVVDAMLEGWDQELTQAALRLAPRFANSTVMDRLDFEVRGQIPGEGLGGMKALLVGDEGRPVSNEAARIIRKIDRFGSIEEWRSFDLTPKDWAARMSALRGLFRHAPPADGASHARALEWRGQAAALNAFEEALSEAALALEADARIALPEYWGAVKSVLRLKPLRAGDGRRNVVHVLTAHEARQWELPVTFVCGVTEGKFPAQRRQDVFFSDWARQRLNEAGIRIRRAEDFEKEERALFDSVAARTTASLTLSYSEFDEGGNPSLPSLFLEGLGLEAEKPPPARLRPARARARAEQAAGGPLEIRAPRLLEAIREKTRQLSPSALESYLTCPFQYFASRSLRLNGRPPRPEKRLDFIAKGEMVHAALAEWYVRRREIGAVFDELFARMAEELHIPITLGAERARQAMREDVEAFAGDARWPRAEFRSQTEKQFEYALGDAVIHGKIDRLDEDAAGRAFVIDYKYSRASSVSERLEDPVRLQAELYLLAAERTFGLRPEGMFYVALRGGVKYYGWSRAKSGEVEGRPIPEGWLEEAGRRALGAVAEIRAGRVKPAPIRPDVCERCDYRDVCRFDAGPAPAAEEESGA